MALNTNPFVEGIDPSGTFGGYASVLLQLIRQAQPSSTYGMILFDTATPDVTGANAWRKRCIWVNLTTPGTPTVNVYKEGGSPGWSNVQALIPPLTIKNSMISNPDPLDTDKGISITKFAPNGGTANQLIRINGTATAFEFVSLSSLVTTGSIPVGSLITTGIPAGQLRFAGVVGPGVATWYDAQQIINALSNAAIGTDLIAPAPVTSTRSKLLTTRTADTFATWRYFEPNVDILNDTMNGSKLQAGTVGPERIYSTGVPDGSVLTKIAGVPDWAAAPLATYKYTAQVALPAAGVDVDVITYAATGGKADIYQFHFVCMTAEHGFDLNDEVPIASWGNDDASNETGPLIWFDNSTSKVIHTGPVNYQIQQINGTRTSIVAPTRGRWNLKVTAIRFA